MGVEQGDQTAAKAAVIDRLVGMQGWRGAQEAVASGLSGC